MTSSEAAENPFLHPSELPFGLPDTDRIRDEHYLPAFEAGMAEQRAEVAAIVEGRAASGEPAEPTFENTIVELERSGATLNRVAALFFARVSADTSPAVQEIEETVAPLLSAHGDAISLDPGLFARIDALHARRDELDLDPESLRLLERHHRDMVRAGAQLSAADQQRLRELNGELSTLSTRFGSALLAGANDAAVHVTDRNRLEGLSDDAVSSAAAAATDRGYPDGWLLTLVLPTAQPVLASLADRSLREELFRASVTRGDGGTHDTRETILAIVRLRAERARLLGYPDHASYVIDDATAGTAAAAREMLESLVPAAVANADREAEGLRELAAADGIDELAPWDWAFYADRYRREHFSVNDTALRPYLELERVIRDGVFRAAELLYGVRFAERTDLPAYHPDVRWWEVRTDDGEVLGLFGTDLWARPSKRGGAWMNSLVDQSSLLGTTPVVLNTLNLNRPPAGEPALLTLDEVRTLFHEFGHALHGLFSAVRYPTFSGTAVPRDFVEFPSQVNEMWMEDPEILASFARHHVTGEPLPAELLSAWQAARGYGEGFDTTEYLAASLLDQAWHALSPEEAAEVDDVIAFERAALERAGVAHPLVPPRYRTTYFNHVFGSGYAAAYYSYIWAEVLDADTVSWFAENGGLNRDNGDRFRRELLSRGGAVDPMAAYRTFRGRDPEITPLLERRGLAAVS
ncbi:M3 family metallopeptidase [Pseudonocardia phyllosphaerae]|uniref:M3 family metallopeptidase n=1 Tax=Pseudonocardia phyllosphaerae TaxID=3390502 RepID=UPI00397B17A2